MAATITKNTDGDVSLGSLRAEIITLTPAASDYPTGGYPIIPSAGTTVGTGNIGMSKVVAVVPLNLPSGFDASWNASTGKVQVFGINIAAFATLTAEVEVTAGTNIGAMTLLVIGL
jgi:hypothetical protein